MKRIICLILIAVLLLSGCAKEETQPEQTAATIATETPQSSPEPTPEHSELHIPGLELEQVLEYFNEVVLDVEYSDGTGDVTLMQKWKMPLRYRIYGEPTDEDWAMLSLLFEQLNRVPGFPGISAAEDGKAENLSFSFMDGATMNESFHEILGGEWSNGATQFWYYTDTNEMYDARIGYRSDIDQASRSSILLEEVINTLGITDTVLREDSIVYQYSDDNLSLSQIDWLILKLLYNPAIECGMDKDACAAVIAELYY